MKNLLLATATVAIFGLAGCATEDKMMKDDAMAKDAMMKDDAMAKDAMMKDDAMAKDAMMKDDAMAKDAMMKDDTMAAGSGSDAMMDLCLSKGGSIGAWAGEGDSTKTCDTAEGNSYPLAQLTSFPEFQ